MKPSLSLLITALFMVSCDQQEPYDPNAQCEMTIRYTYATSLDEAKRNPELWINRYDSPAEYADASVRMLFLTGVC